MRNILDDETNLRIQVAETMDQARQEGASDQPGYADAERVAAARLTRTFGQGLMQSLIMCSGDVDPGSAGSGGTDAMRAPFEQLHVEKLLECDDVAAHAGFPHMQHPCGLSEAALVNGRENIVQPAERVLGVSHRSCPCES